MRASSKNDDRMSLAQLTNSIDLLSRQYSGVATQILMISPSRITNDSTFPAGLYGVTLRLGEHPGQGTC